MDIRGLDKAAVLKVLHDHARSQGLGFLHFRPEGLTLDECRALLDAGQVYFDYLQGRLMKVDLSGDDVSLRLYDRDNGGGAGEAAIRTIMGEEKAA